MERQSERTLRLYILQMRKQGTPGRPRASKRGKRRCGNEIIPLDGMETWSSPSAFRVAAGVWK